MPQTKITELDVKSFLQMLINLGEDAFYHQCLGLGEVQLAKGVEHPEVDLLEISEAFFIAFRRSGDERLLIAARIIRRAAHTVYRNRKNKKYVNRKFLQAV